MTAELFAKQLKGMAPSKEKLKSLNLEDSFIDFFIGRYYCIPRKEINQGPNSNDPILQLLQLYDCSHVQIGGIEFLSLPIENDRFYQIGNIEADILSINKISKEIEVLDYTNLNHRIWKCASNQKAFLGAVLICAEYYSNNVINPEKFANPIAKRNYFEESLEKAGGNEYREFYQMLMGYY